MKKDIKKLTTAGIMLPLGAGIAGKIGTTLGTNSTIRNNISSGFDIASISAPLIGAKMTMDNTNRLFQKKQKRKRGYY